MRKKTPENNQPEHQRQDTLFGYWHKDSIRGNKAKMEWKRYLRV
jgi:hypothetical protein